MGKYSGSTSVMVVGRLEPRGGPGTTTCLFSFVRGFYGFVFVARDIRPSPEVVAVDKEALGVSFRSMDMRLRHPLFGVLFGNSETGNRPDPRRIC